MNSKPGPSPPSRPENGTRFVVFAALVLTCRSARAYIDPGTLAIVLQATVGAVAAAAVALRKRIAKLLCVFRRPADREDAADALKTVDGDLADGD